MTDPMEANRLVHLANASRQLQELIAACRTLGNDGLANRLGSVHSEVMEAMSPRQPTFYDNRGGVIW